MAGPASDITKAIDKWVMGVVTGKIQTTQKNKDSIYNAIGVSQVPTEEAPASVAPVTALFNAYAPNALYPKMRDEGRRNAAGQGMASSAVVSGNLGGNVSGLFGSTVSGFPGGVSSSRTTLLGG